MSSDEEQRERAAHIADVRRCLHVLNRAPAKMSAAGLLAAYDDLRQAVWDAYIAMGFDTDGNDTPAGVQDLPGLIRRCASEMRADYDQACEDVYQLENRLSGVGGTTE